MADDDDEVLFDEDDEDNVEYEDDDEDDGASGGADSDDFDPDDIDLDDFDLDDDDEESDGGSKKKIVVLGIAGVLVIALATAGGLLVFLGGDEEEAAAGDELSNGAVASLVIPRKNKMRSSRSLLKDQVASGKMTASRPKKGLTPSTAGRDRAAGNSPRPQPPSSSQKSQSDQSKPSQQPAPEQSGTPAPPSPGASSARPPAATNSQSSARVTGAKVLRGSGMNVPSITAAAYRAIPVQPKSKPLSAPIAALIEPNKGQDLPRKGSSGQLAWQTYSHPFKGTAGQPRIGLIVRDLGLSRNSTLAAINLLPAAVTLSFTPYARGVDEWMGLARTAGHETLLALPLETIDFPASDPGPMALLTDVKVTENVARLNRILALSKAYVGLIQFMGSRFATSEAAYKPVLEIIRDRGLLYVDDGQVTNGLGNSIGTKIGLPIAKNSLIVDDDPSHTAVLNNLHRLEAIAKKQKFALGLISAYPVTLRQISKWVPTLKIKKIDLAPVSALVQDPSKAKPAGTAGADGQAGEEKK